MKKFTLIIALLISGITMAQTPIVLDINDLGTAGKYYQQRMDTTPSGSIQPGVAGANVSWNFAALASQDTISIDLINSTDAPLHGYFPNANIAAVYDSALNVFFFNRSASGLAMHGIVNDYLRTGDSVKLVLNEADTALKLPGTYELYWYGINTGDSKSPCNFTFDTNIGGFPVTVPIDTIRVKHYQQKWDSIDSWGQIILPNNTVDALRLKSISISVDSIWGYANVPPPYQSYSGWYSIIVYHDSSLSYNWWMKSLGVPVVTMNMFQLSNTIIEDVAWVYNTPSGISEQEEVQVMVYPNPAGSQIIFENPVRNFASVSLLDLLGKEVYSTYKVGSSKVVVPVTSFEDGIYIYRITYENGTTHSGKIVVKH